MTTSNSESVELFLKVTKEFPKHKSHERERDPHNFSIDNSLTVS